MTCDGFGNKVTTGFRKKACGVAGLGESVSFSIDLRYPLDF